jgi:hypothetical protein
MHIERWRLKKFRNYPADAKKSCSRREKLQEPLMALQTSVVYLIKHEPICAASRESDRRCLGQTVTENF